MLQTYGKYIENSNIQWNIKNILHLVQEFYFEMNVKFKQNLDSIDVCEC